VVLVGSTTASAPSFFAISMWVFMGSTPITWRAPSARATAMAKRPMVPQPMMATDLPRRFTLVQACTALPKGSWSAATSGRILVTSVGQSAWAGSFTYSAKQPSTLMPMMRSVAQTWLSPMRHW